MNILAHGGMLTREAPASGSFSPESLEIEAVIATRHPVTRRDARGLYIEILDPAGLVLSGDDWPLLADHRPTARETIGRVHDVRIDGDTVLARLRFSGADDLLPIRQRVQDGTLRAFSAGYSVEAWAEGKDETGQRTKTATRWHLKEVSLVAIPADPNATRRSDTMPFDIETRNALIDTLRGACNLSDEWGADLGAEAVTDDDVRRAARDAMTQRAAPPIRVTRENGNPAEIQTRAADALAFRMAGGALPEASREYVNVTLREMAADALQRSGVSTRGMSADEVFSRSLSASDFPLLVSNAMGKVAAQAYQAAESPLKALARQRTLPNFKTTTAIRIGEMGRLEEMTEHGEFTHTSRAEAGETMSLKTFGRAISVSRKLLIDDDLGLLGDMTSAMGAAAAQTEADELVKLLADNPIMSDGLPVFHVSRGNIATGPGSDMLDPEAAVAALLEARRVMRTITGLDGRTILSVKPRYLVVGADLEAHAEKALASIYAATTHDVNPMAGKLELVVEPRLIGNTWFVMADPAAVPSLQYAYLSSAQGVQIQRQEAWDTLGLKYRAFLDFGCGWLDWRGAYRSTGAA
ncbi:Mu-like prophage major head subunit gpT family protein [Paracoccus nototheniae]|uniref:Mu-like prophage major head subunit gpT family protein n=1 Tax=Paracoccus nototheniae TaxID=2489002 RepID=A0ABW4DZ12_9RHOB|nr:Mu-like prophage major head subunit gpT family protein [Paracoccus nototheniae]